MHGLQGNLEWRPQKASAEQRQLNKRFRVIMAAIGPIFTAHPTKGILQAAVGQDGQEQGMQVEDPSERNAIPTAAQDDSTNPRHQSQTQKTDAQQSNHQPESLILRLSSSSIPCSIFRVSLLLRLFLIFDLCTSFTVLVSGFFLP